MMFWGIQVKKPNQKDVFVIGLVVLFMFVFTVPASLALGEKPQALLAFTMAGASGALLCVSGIRVQDGLKQFVLICISSLIFGGIGLLLGTLLLPFFS